MKLSRPYYLCKSDRVVVLFLLAVLALRALKKSPFFMTKTENAYDL